MKTVITVAIVEDKEPIRQSLAILVDGAEGYSCQATFENAEAALDYLPTHAVDVVLMDIDLPGMNGIDCVRHLKALCPYTQFMMCTMYDEDETVFDALKAGANAYILKRSPPHKLLEAITELHEGGAPMSSTIARKIASSFYTSQAVSPELEALSSREREILDRLAKGHSHKEVANELFISPTTVRKHIFNIYGKLQVHSRVEAINKYLGRK
ncbi:response regulator transcription factor [Spirosoma utsteinense]|uniref:DNA-binding NarL/FixJ family response regulator n=1 Tax=Spirosoma utsteinense TaxID=2585773 RepID=A0ABR6W8N5_9BACT|nr:response regulator transcription factor [Spirosoma utsteinense]MBC3787253.1 DNA-binding NarL/FixJ family response regulator [Spirosoma utsteinense]MBC3792939.1 DNA-binding NarL/FixJ family response regulator [Spirosoma utsteinense]